MQRLAGVFSEAPNSVLRKLVDIGVEFCAADSAGISLEEADETGNLRFRWVVIAGSFSQYVNGTTPRFFSPCGTCLSTGRPQHYRVSKPYYDYLGKESLLLSSDQTHLVAGRFDVERMMETLKRALNEAVNDGYDGLWATGDMTWEFGPKQDFSKLMEYEWDSKNSCA